MAKKPLQSTVGDKPLQAILNKAASINTIAELTAFLRNNQQLIASNATDPLAPEVTKQIMDRWQYLKSSFKPGNITSPSELANTFKRLDALANDMESFALEARQSSQSLISYGTIAGGITQFKTEQQKYLNTQGIAVMDRTSGINNLTKREEEQRRLAASLTEIRPTNFMTGAIQNKIEQNLINTRKDRQKAENAASFYDANKYARDIATAPLQVQVAGLQAKIAEIPELGTDTPEGMTAQYKRHKLEQKLYLAQKGLTQETITGDIEATKGLPLGPRMAELSKIAENIKDPRYSRVKKDVQRQQGRIFQEEAEQQLGAANQRWGIENNKLVEYSPEQRMAKITAAGQAMTSMLGPNPDKYLKEISEGINGKVVGLLGKAEIDLKKQAEVSEKIAAQSADRDRKIISSTTAAHPILTRLMARKEGEDAGVYAGRVDDRSRQIGAVTGGVGAIALAAQAGYGAVVGQQITAPLEVTQMRYGMEGQRQNLALQALSYSPEAMVRFSGMYGGLTGPSGNNIANQLAKQQTEAKKTFDRNMGLMDVAKAVGGGALALGGLGLMATGAGAVPGMGALAIGANLLGSSVPGLSQNPFYQQYMGPTLASKGAATYDAAQFKAQQDYIEAEMRKQQVNVAKMGQYQTGLEAYSAAVDMVGGRALNPVDLARGLVGGTGGGRAAQQGQNLDGLFPSADMLGEIVRGGPIRADLKRHGSSLEQNQTERAATLGYIGSGSATLGRQKVLRNTLKQQELSLKNNQRLAGNLLDAVNKTWVDPNYFAARGDPAAVEEAYASWQSQVEQQKRVPDAVDWLSGEVTKGKRSISATNKSLGAIPSNLQQKVDAAATRLKTLDRAIGEDKRAIAVGNQTLAPRPGSAVDQFFSKAATNAEYDRQLAAANQPKEKSWWATALSYIGRGKEFNTAQDLKAIEKSLPKTAASAITASQQSDEVKQLQTTNQQLANNKAYLSGYGVDISDYSRKAAQFSSILGKGSVGQTNRAMEGVYKMGLAGVGSFDQLLGNVSQMNAITGKADASKDLRAVLTEAVKTGFDTSRTGQQFVQSTISLAQATGINSVTAAGGLLGSTAALMGGRERDLMLAQQGITGQANLMNNPAVASMFNVGFMTSGAMKDPMRNVLYALNQSPVKAKQAQTELKAFQDKLAAGGDPTLVGMKFIKEHPELVDESRSLIRAATTGDNAKDAAKIIESNKKAVGQSNDVIGMFVKSLGGAGVGKITSLNDELAGLTKKEGESKAQFKARRDLAVYNIQGEVNKVSGKVADMGGFDPDTVTAYLSGTLSKDAQKQIQISSGRTTFETMEEKGKTAKARAASFQSLRATANSAMMGLGGKEAEAPVGAAGGPLAGLMESLVKGGQQYKFTGQDYKAYEIDAKRAKSLMAKPEEALGEGEKAFAASLKEKAGQFGQRQAMSNLDMGENVQKVQVMNFEALVGHLKSGQIGSFNTASN